MRVAVALSTLDAAVADWHFARRAPCSLVFDEQSQWLVGCAADGLAGFVRTGEQRAGAPIFHHPRSLTLDTKHVPYEHAKRLVGQTRRGSRRCSTTRRCCSGRSTVP